MSKPNVGDTVRATALRDGTIVEGKVKRFTDWGFWIGETALVLLPHDHTLTWEITKHALPPEPSAGSVVAFGNFATQRFAHGWLVMAEGSHSYSWEGLNDYMQSCGVVAQPVILREGWAV